MLCRKVCYSTHDSKDSLPLLIFAVSEQLRFAMQLLVQLERIWKCEFETERTWSSSVCGSEPQQLLCSQE